MEYFSEKKHGANKISEYNYFSLCLNNCVEKTGKKVEMAFCTPSDAFQAIPQRHLSATTIWYF